MAKSVRIMNDGRVPIADLAAYYDMPGTHAIRAVLMKGGFHYSTDKIPRRGDGIMRRHLMIPRNEVDILCAKMGRTPPRASYYSQHSDTPQQPSTADPHYQLAVEGVLRGVIHQLQADCYITRLVFDGVNIKYQQRFPVDYEFSLISDES